MSNKTTKTTKTTKTSAAPKARKFTPAALADAREMLISFGAKNPTNEMILKMAKSMRRELGDLI